MTSVDIMIDQAFASHDGDAVTDNDRTLEACERRARGRRSTKPNKLAFHDVSAGELIEKGAKGGPLGAESLRQKHRWRRYQERLAADDPGRAGA
jgi:hypothetical protein